MHEVNDWILFNSIVYKIYTVPDDAKMRLEFLVQLSRLIDFDAADFYLAKGDGGAGLENPVFYNCDGVYSGYYDELDYSRGILYSGVCMVYRETDIISDEIRVNTEYYNKLYRSNGWHYAVQMILSYEKRFVGVVTLYRDKGKENFCRDDTMLLDLLKDHLAYRLYTGAAGAEKKEELDLGAFADKYLLTKREQTVLCSLWEGKDDKSVSEELSISIHTLKKHILNIYRKTGINTRGQLMTKVARWSMGCPKEVDK